MITKEIKYLVLSVLFIGIAINLSRTTWNMLKSRERLVSLDSEVVGLRERKEDIENSIEYKKTDAFVEDFARNELNLIKPGEDVVVISTNTGISLDINSNISGFSYDENIGNISVFEKWMSLLF